MRTISILIITCLSLNVLAQSPWVPDKSSGYAQLGLTSISSYGSIYLDGNSDYRLNREVTDLTLQLYGEYGIANNLGLSISIPYKMLSTGSNLLGSPTDPTLVNQEGTHNILGNLELALIRNFINRSFLLSGQLKVELPTGSLDDATGLRSGLDALTITPTISVGKGSAKMYGYAAIGSGIRFNNYSSDIRISAELGTKEFDRLWIVVVLDVVQSFDNGSATGEKPIQMASGLYLNNQEYFAYGLKGVFEVKKNLGVNGGVYGGVSGNLVAKAPSLNLGVYYKW